MRRRDFITVLGSAVIWSRAANADQAAKQYRLAFVHSGLPTHELTETAGPFWIQQFFAAMRRLGYAEGSNLIVERYSAEGHHDRFKALAQDVIARKPDLIVANFNALVSAFKMVPSAIPIIGVVADPVRTGLIAGLARPGGNLTGVSIDPGLEINGKRVQMLKELIPSAARIASLASRGEWDGVGGQELRAAGQQLDVSIRNISLQQVTSEELRRVFAEIGHTGLDALLVGSSGDFLAHRRLIVELAERERLPTMYSYRDYVELGGLVAYGPDLAEMAGRLADQVHQVLNGAPPGEIPFYQPTRLELVINLKTAKALGLVVPPTIIAQADQMIE